jgi:hypothetical protein
MWGFDSAKKLEGLAVSAAGIALSRRIFGVSADRRVYLFLRGGL